MVGSERPSAGSEQALPRIRTAPEISEQPVPLFRMGISVEVRVVRLAWVVRAARLAGALGQSGQGGHGGGQGGEGGEGG